MFQNAIAAVMQAALSQIIIRLARKYVKNIESNLKLSLWAGDVVLNDLELVVGVFKNGVEDSAVLSSKDDLEQVVLARIVMHINRDDGARSRACQEVLVRANLSLLLVEVADPVNLIAVPVDVEQFVITDQDTVNTLTINVHLPRVLLLDKVLVNQFWVPPHPVQVSSGDLFSFRSHGPKLTILQIDMLEAILSFRNMIKELGLEVEGLL